jgi:hypothetical protein
VTGNEESRVADVAGTQEIERGAGNAPDPAFDWRRVAYLVHLSRAMDRLEEEELVPARKVLYQFSARGHDMAQILLGTRLTEQTDAVCGYYRSRPLLLSLGVPLEDALGSNMGRAGGYSDGRDIGVVFNFPNATARRRSRCRAASARNIRRPRLGAGDPLLSGRAEGPRLRSVDRGGARRRCVGGDQRLLGGADHRDDAAAADALLHRGQWLRHLRAVQLPDAGRRHRPQPGQLRQSGDHHRRRHRTGEAARLVAQAVAHVRGGKGPALLRSRCRGCRATPTRIRRPTRPRISCRRNGAAIRCRSSARTWTVCARSGEWERIEQEAQGHGRYGARVLPRRAPWPSRPV